MTTKKKIEKKTAKKSAVIAGRGDVFQYKVNDPVIVEVGQGRGCVGRVMSLDPPNGYVKVRLGGSTHYQYAPENVRHLDFGHDLAPGTVVMFKRDGVEYTIKRAFRMDNTTCAMVEEVPYHISLEGWNIQQNEPVELLNTRERTQYEAFRGIAENFVAQCKTQGLVELVTIHTLPLDVQLRTATESLMRAYGGLMCRLAAIRNSAG